MSNPADFLMARKLTEEVL